MHVVVEEQLLHLFGHTIPSINSLEPSDPNFIINIPFFSSLCYFYPSQMTANLSLLKVDIYGYSVLIVIVFTSIEGPFDTPFVSKIYNLNFLYLVEYKSEFYQTIAKPLENAVISGLSVFVFNDSASKI